MVNLLPSSSVLPTFATQTSSILLRPSLALPMTVDNAGDFSVGNTVVFFTRAGVSTTRTVTAKTATTLTVADLDVALPRFSGVRPQGSNDTISVSTGTLTQAYGNETHGTDGGCFVEFQASSGGSAIPKYTAFPNDGDITSFAFCNHWFSNTAASDNLFQLVACHEHADGSMGTTDAGRNICFITLAGHKVDTDGFVEFCKDCIDDIRAAADPR